MLVSKTLSEARMYPVEVALDSVLKQGSLPLLIVAISQSDCPRLAGGTMPFIRKYSTICP